MKHNPEITQKIIDLKKVGFKSRYIGKALGVSKSSAHHRLECSVQIRMYLDQYLD